MALPLQNGLRWGHFTRSWGKIIIRSGRVHDRMTRLVDLAPYCNSLMIGTRQKRVGDL